MSQVKMLRNPSVGCGRTGAKSPRNLNLPLGGFGIRAGFFSCLSGRFHQTGKKLRPFYLPQFSDFRSAPACGPALFRIGLFQFFTVFLGSHRPSLAGAESENSRAAKTRVRPRLSGIWRAKNFRKLESAKSRSVASSARVRDKFLRDLQIGVFWEHVSFCATTWLHPAAQGCKATLGR